MTSIWKCPSILKGRVSQRLEKRVSAKAGQIERKAQEPEEEKVLLCILHVLHYRNLILYTKALPIRKPLTNHLFTLLTYIK